MIMIIITTIRHANLVNKIAKNVRIILGNV